MVHELTPRLLDAISGTGELLAAPLVAAAIRAAGVPSSPVDATELIVTTEQFGGAEPLVDATEAKTAARLRPADRSRRDPGGHRLHRRDRRWRADHARTRRIGLLGLDPRRGAERRRGLDLDRRQRRDDRESRRSAGGAIDGRDLVQRSVGARVLRRQGPALQDDPAGLPQAHPGAHPQQLQPVARRHARQRRRRHLDAWRQGGDLDPEGQPDCDQRHRHAGDTGHRRQGVRRRGRAAGERADDFAGLVREQHLLRHQLDRKRRASSAHCAPRSTSN